jgi:hypothetical protein
MLKTSLLLVTLLFSACSVTNYEHTQPKIVIIKSPKIKFADLGYIRNSDSAIELELFVAGNAVEKISINHLICVSAGCMSRSGFNSEYLDASYPSNLLQNILLGKEIFDGKNRVEMKDGFKQKIDSKDFEINYRVDHSSIFFKDRKNAIIFKIKDTK